MTVFAATARLHGGSAYDRTNTVDAIRHSPHSNAHADAAVRGLVSDLVAQLTEGQRDCLRLVFQHMTSKDIARALDISPHTVDMRLRTAMKTLAVASRIDAARLLVETEGQGTSYQPLIYQAPDVAGSADAVTMHSPASTATDDDADQQFSPQSSPENEPPAGGPPRPAGASFRYDDVRYAEERYQSARFVDAPPELLPWGRRNTLSPGARVAWIAGIAIGSALGFGAIVGALEALKNLL